MGPHCRKLLLLYKINQNKGLDIITCIDDEPFPKIITNVPSTFQTQIVIQTIIRSIRR